MGESRPQLTNVHLTRAFIHLDRFKDNMALLKRLASNRALFPAVKANAYGHGIKIIAPALVDLGYTTLCVAHIPEAIEIRENFPAARCIILSPTLPENAPLIVEYDFQPVVADLDFVAALNDAALKKEKQIGIHLKVDTGMGRVGIPPENVLEFLDSCRAYSNINIQGIMSHFARADEADQLFSARQIEVFSAIKKKTAKYCIPCYHIANSAAIFDLPAAHFDAVRPGISIYGLRPSSEIRNPAVKFLKPVMSLETRITQLKRVPPHTGLSYGHAFITEKSSLIATVPCGYGDGYLRSLSNRAEVLVGGSRCRQVGRICMDQMLIDVTPLQGQVKTGDGVVLIGRQGEEEITAEELAGKIGTINYEIVTAIAHRVPRIPL